MASNEAYHQGNGLAEITQEASLEVDRRQISEHYSQVDDLIGDPPGWLLRSGISLLLLAFALITALTFVIKYPDKMMASAIITSDNPPIEVLMPLGARIDKMLVTDGDIVEKEAVLAYLESTTKRDNLLDLQTWILQILDCEDLNSLIRISVPNQNWSVGELQPSVEQLIVKSGQFRLLAQQMSPRVQLAAIDREVRSTEALNAQIDLESDLFNQEWQILKRDLERAKILYEQGVISAQEYEQRQSDSLGLVKQMEKMVTGRIQNEIRISQLHSQYTEKEEDHRQQLNLSWFEIRDLASEIQALINAWYHKYSLRAARSGRVHLSANIKEHFELPLGALFCTIEPDTSSRRIALAYIPSQGIGKIESNCKVLIRLEAYPHQEFGSIESTLSVLAGLPKLGQDGQATYEGVAELPDQVATNTGFKVPLLPNMLAEMILITRDRSVAARILTQFLNLFEN